MIADRLRARLFEYALVTTVLCVAAAFVTWPHARYFSGYVLEHVDPLFSMWRLAWFSHAVRTGSSLVGGNIFSPEPSSILYSDAMFLEGALAMPAIASGVKLPLIYNTLLLAGMVSSGLALYHVATRKGVSRSASLIGAIVLAVAPYRMDHLMHLELQWVAPAILAFAALDDLLCSPRWRHAVTLALMTWLQFLACVYYAVFLLPLLAVLALVGLAAAPHPRLTVAYGAAACGLAAALTLPMAALYTAHTDRLSPRPIADLATYSATGTTYIAAPPENTLYGHLADRFGLITEKRSFPGLAALGLACVGLFSKRRRLVIGAVLVTALAADLSLGVNGVLYPTLFAIWPTLHGLRAPARYAVFVLAGVAMLASLGGDRLMASASLRARALVVSAVIVVLCVEYRSPQMKFFHADLDPPVYDFMATLPRGVVVELPFSQPLHRHAIDLDADYIYWSTRHWQPLVNGYSGYYPKSYVEARERMESFPDAASLAFLRQGHVRYVVVHLGYMNRETRGTMLTDVLRLDTFTPLGTYLDWSGPTAVFETRP